MEIPRITPHEVAEHLRRGEAVAFVDARSTKAYDSATEQIPHSLRIAPGEVDAHASSVPRGALVVAYCT